MEYIDKALEHTPTLIEAYMVKARIYKVLKSLPGNNKIIALKC